MHQNSLGCCRSHTCTCTVQPESGCPYAGIWAPREPHVLNHMITEGECKQNWFTCFHKYFWSKPYVVLRRKILEIRIKRIIEIIHGMRKLITFLWILGYLTLKLDCTQGLNNTSIVSHQHFLKFSLPKFKWKQIMQKDIGDMQCKLWKNDEIQTLKFLA